MEGEGGVEDGGAVEGVGAAAAGRRRCTARWMRAGVSCVDQSACVCAWTGQMQLSERIRFGQFAVRVYAWRTAKNAFAVCL